MQVKDLINILKEYPQDLYVAYRCCSENVMLEREKLEINELCAKRADGWVANARPDKPTKKYLVFPGN